MINKIAKTSDYAVILGGYSEMGRGFYKATDFNKSKMWIYKNDASLELVSRNNRHVGIRPSVYYNNIKNNSKVVFEGDDYLLIEFGEMPQKIVSEYVDINKLRETGRTYTTDLKKNLYCEKKVFRPEIHLEYSYNDKRYVFASRVRHPNINDLDYTFANDKNNHFKLSNGLVFSAELPILLEVMPVLWYVDKSSGIATTVDIILAGIRDIDAQYYLNNYFFKEINYDYENKKSVCLDSKKVKVRKK